ncbi:MAG: DUF371 domain-containing protein [Methanolinea sp.]|jgi:hypothetical protein|nr:DUF371 domain-containing protein [Methanolinea sp.]
MTREAEVTIPCRGHPLVTAEHPTTLEITREQDLTLAGNCIIGVGAQCGARDLPSGFRALLCRDDALLLSVFSCEGMVVEVRARGSSSMTLDHPTDLVWRRSHYVCGRTVAVDADTTARTIPRDFVEALRKGSALTVVLTVTVPG